MLAPGRRRKTADYVDPCLASKPYRPMTAATGMTMGHRDGDKMRQVAMVSTASVLWLG